LTCVKKKKGHAELAIINQQKLARVAILGGYLDFLCGNSGRRRCQGFQRLQAVQQQSERKTGKDLIQHGKMS
jgi:hypothetical protein